MRANINSLNIEGSERLLDLRDQVYRPAEYACSAWPAEHANDGAFLMCLAGVFSGTGSNSTFPAANASTVTLIVSNTTENDAPHSSMFSRAIKPDPAKNTEAERRACEIRLRAERKAGQLRRQEEKAKGFNAKSPPPSGGRTPTNEERRSQLGISKKQDEQWQALAGVPEEDFEAALGSEKKPSTSGIIAKPRKMPATSLWLWGRLSPKISMT